MEYHSKLNFTQNGMSLKMEFNSKWNVTKMEYHFKSKFTQHGMSLKMECHS